MPASRLDTEIRYRLLKLLELSPGLSQRELAAELGAGLGKMNCILRGLVDRGWVRVENFRRSDNKLAYLYRLTPQGLSQKAALALRFLHLKRAEHERLMTEIEELRAEVGVPDPHPRPNVQGKHAGDLQYADDQRRPKAANLQRACRRPGPLGPP